jgi:hypothetical protein
MKSFKQISEEVLSEGDDRYPADDMTMSELKIAVNAAQNILDMLEDGAMIQRWQISAIVKASDELASVCTNMRADVDAEMEDEEEWLNGYEEDEEPMYVGFEYPSMYGEETKLDEQIKGWKHAGSDLAKMRAAKGKDVKLVSLKKDGAESKMHDASKMFRSEDEAQEHHDRVTKLNPKSKIRHNLYVDGKHVKTLGEEAELDEAADGTKRNRELFATGRISKDEFDKRMGYGKYKTKDNSKKLDGPGGLYKNLVKRLGEEDELNEVNKSQLGKHIGTVNGYHIHDLGANYTHKTKRFVAAANHYGWLSHTGGTAKEVTDKAKELKTSTTPPAKSQADMDHDDWRDKQKQRISSGEVRQAVMSKRAKNEETDYKVTVDGLPDMYVKADSPSEVKNSLRKVVKNPEMIKNVERIARASLQKMFRDKASGKEE